jgi:hypothetical protein
MTTRTQAHKAPNMLNDYLIIDGTTDVADDFEYYAALQRQINNGTVWLMQGFCGRAAMDAIENGSCLCGITANPDAYGNMVPGRNDLQPGTKGTYEFVVARQNKDWATRMAAVSQATVAA